MPDDVPADAPSLGDMAFSPFTLEEFMTCCTRGDAEAARVPLSTFYDWKKGTHDLTLTQFHALVRIKRCYIRIVHGVDKEKLATIKQERTGRHTRTEPEA